ncbi:hypothetical protein HF325_004359 [Metschnikowia pulcherrima]|uniref:NAD(P)-binding domain-containing protein n=1 Tax=Metschnikowia pulcherrima TaxID=27326 RepID=A0A8H7LBH8_9ASCO|nr:hypothetical protein HF325_004359 [Metschnikowia pulcherrima]
MSKVIVFGSHGKVGQKLIKLLDQADKYQTTAVIRNSEQAETIKNISQATKNVSTTELDIGDSSVQKLAKTIEGHNAVVLTVGSGGKGLLKVDLDGVVKAFEAAVQAKVRRLVLVSALYAFDREFGAASPLRDYYIAKHYADRILQNEFKDSLDFTILRPTHLTDGEGTGKVAILKGEKDLGHIDRQDVAQVIFEVLDKKSTYGRAYDFKAGDSEISSEKTWA